MAKIITRYSNSAGATLPVGLTTGELAVNIVQRRVFVGGTAGTVELAGLSANTFTALNTFNAGISAASVRASRAVLGSAAASDGVTIDGVLNCSQPVYFNNSISPGGGIYTQNIAFPYVAFPNAALEVAGSSFSVFFAGISASGITVSGRINLPTRPPKTNDTTAATTAFVQNEITSGTVTSINGKTGAFGISGGQGITTPKLDSFGNLVPAINYLNGGISITQKTRFSEKDVLLFQEASTTNRDIYITSVKALKNYVLGLSGSGDTLIPPPGGVLQSLSFIGLTQSGDTLTDYVVGFTALQSQVLIDAVTRYNGLTGSVQGVSALNGITGGITLNAGTNIGITFTRAGGITVSVSGLASSDNVVTSFNGRTGAVQGVSAAVAGTGISVSGATGAVTITNIGVQSFNGLTGAITGVGSIVAGTNVTISPTGGTGAVTINATQPTVNNGTLTMNASGNGISGTQTFTANQAGNGTFTVTSNATDANTASTIVFRDASGNFSAGTITAALTGTASNASSLGNTAAASWALLNSPTFTGTPAAPTAVLGTNTTQIATTAFVQNEIVADTVTTFNGRTGAAQGVSAAVAGTGISVSGATGAVTITNIGVQSFNGLTGALTGVGSIVAGTNITISPTGGTGAVTINATQPTVNNGTLTLGVSGNGISGTQTFTANQAGNATFTVTSNATNANTGSTIVFRDASGNFSAGTITAALTGTASNASSLGNTAAASWALLNSPTFTGTPAAPTAALGTNTTQIATTAFVQNEIVADTVTTFNGRTGSVQGVSAAVAGTGISVSGATGAVTITNTGVLSFNGNAGAVTGASLGANTFTALNTFNAGIKSNIYEPLTGGAGVTFGLLSGGGQGNIHFLASEIRVGGTSTLQGITLTTVTGVTLTVRPRHNMIVSPINGEVTITNQGTALDLGTRPSILIQNDGTGNGQVRIAGGDLRIGTKFISGGFSDSPCNIVFLNQDGVTTTITTNASGSNKTITLPNTTGTVALDANANVFTALQSFTAGISAAGATLSGNVTVGGDVAVNGGDLTTTAATATLFNSGATTLSVGGAATTTNIATVASGLTLNIATGANGSEIKNIYIGSGSVGGGSARTTIGYNGGLIVSHGSGITVGDSGGGYFINLRSTTTNVTGTMNASGALNSTGLFTTTGGLSASGGVTFNTPIVSTRIPRVSSAVFDTKTADFSPVEADNGKVFVINISGKSSLTVTLDGLSTGWRAKFLVLGGSGTVFVSTTGTVLGTFGADGNAGAATGEMVEVYCYGTNTYFAG